MTKDNYYLGIAKAVASKSKCLRKHYGAVIVNNDEIVATGYNGCCRGEQECAFCTKIKANKDEAEYASCPAVHAEQNAMLSASRKEMLGGTLYLYGYDVEDNKDADEVAPCEICLRLIKNSGLDRVCTSSGAEYIRNKTNGLLLKVKYCRN